VSGIVRRLFGPTALALAVVLCIGWLGWFRPIELRLQDLISTLDRHTETSDLVLVEIDALSLRHLHEWPWPRRYHAQLLDRLREAGVDSVFYDVDFSSTSDPEDDALLARALAGYARERIMLPAFRQPARSGGKNALILTLPRPEFLVHSTLASVNLHPDNDGLVRRIAASWRTEDTTVTLAGVRMSGHMGSALERDVRIDYSIAPATFARFSFADVLSGNVDVARLRGKHVIVGATAIELGDILPVPVYRSLPGAVVQALSYQTLKKGGLRAIPGLVTFAATVCLAFLMSLVFRRTGWRGGSVLLAVGPVLLLGVAFYLHHAWHVLADIAPLLGILTICYAFSMIARLEQQHLRLIIQAFDLRRKDRLMAAVVDNSIDAILTVSSVGIITSVNPAARRLFGAESEALVGQSIAAWIEGLAPPSANSDPLSALLEGMSDGTCERRARRIDGGRFPVEMSLSCMEMEGEVVYTVFVRDITERMEQRAILEYQATHDALTGLKNRFQLRRSLDQMLGDETAAQIGVALLLIDLDKFKEINDTMGHGIGDQILKQVARRFESCVDGGAVLARIGGDEFAIAVQVQREKAVDLAERLLASMESPFPIGDVAFEIGASIGVAGYPQDADSATRLLQNADTAMYAAKQNRLGMTAFQPEFTRRNALHLLISTGLRPAIEEGCLEVYYQPKLDLMTGATVGAEALLRWNHPAEGFLNPEDIVEVAENTGLIWPLTEWMLKATVAHARIWQARGHAIRVAVNLSARLLQDVTLVEKVARYLATDIQWLSLEITESAIMGDPETALKNTRALEATGIPLSIDDFGTGYSSLSYLKKLPVRELKIDKSFVLDMLNDNNDALIVRSTIDLAHNLGLKVVAEGVESYGVLLALRDLGCDIAQGHYLSQPIGFDQMTDWLAEHRDHDFFAATDVARLSVIR